MVGAIQYYVVVVEDVQSVGWCEVIGMLDVGRFWIEPAIVSIHKLDALKRSSPSQIARCTLNLFGAYLVGCVDDLAVQIGQLYGIAVDQAYRSNTSTGQVYCRRASQSTSPNDEDFGMLELELTWNMPMSLEREG